MAADLAPEEAALVAVEGDAYDAELTKAQASEHIDRLQKANPRAQG
mgnify:CR=1 FL=1